MRKLFTLIIVLLIVASSIACSQKKLTAVVYASYFGGSNGEANCYITADKSGNVILAGHTFSTDFPLVNAFDSTFKGGKFQSEDAYVTKFNPDMTTIIFSTYLGGNDYDEIKAVSVDSLGNIYLTGSTTSTDFPITENAYDKSYNGDAGPGSFGDVFLTKLSPSGELLYSTFIGGNLGDCAYGLRIIDTSVVCIAGNTKSGNFPISEFSDNYKEGYDLFLLKLNISSNKLIFSRYFGGNGDERPLDLKIDKSDNIYICGYTKSSDFPLLKGLNSSFKEGQDGFISKFDKDGNLFWTSLIGGNGNDGINGIDINNNELYFIGSSNSSVLECTSNAFHNHLIGGYDAILGKINSSGDSIKYFSYFGGSSDENILNSSASLMYFYGKLFCIGVDTVAIMGVTNSNNFPKSENNQFKGSADIFISVLDITAKKILYSSLYGGSGYEYPESMAILNDSVIFITGTTTSNDFPTTLDAFYKTFQGGSGDDFFARFKLKTYVP
jgi:hypothetical protein